MKRRPRVPIGLVIAIVALLVMGAAAGPLIQATATPEQMRDNVLLSAIPFILIFAAVVLSFITLIVLVASVLSHNISPVAYRRVERLLIAGIVLGVLGMFQPWLHILYQLGFAVLLFSTLGFILWSHIVPRGQRQVELTSVAVSEIEQSTTGAPG
jgi:hypothetical protein